MSTETSLNSASLSTTDVLKSDVTVKNISNISRSIGKATKRYLSSFLRSQQNKEDRQRQRNTEEVKYARAVFEDAVTELSQQSKSHSKCGCRKK